MKPGEELFYVPRHGAALAIEIEKVGRRWATVKGWPRLRIDVSTLQADGNGYASPGQAYRNENDYRAKVELHREWSDLQRFVREHWSPPTTAENIRIALAALRGTLSQPNQQSDADHDPDDGPDDIPAP